MFIKLIFKKKDSYNIILITYYIILLYNLIYYQTYQFFNKFFN